MEGSDNELSHHDLPLLDKVEAMLRVEERLTWALDRASPWLDGAPVHTHRRRVRPVPHSMQQAEQVLKYARVLSNRTSAPAGWNPNAPVVGFSTPNPLPHQLRGGALATLQLERARRQRQQLEMEMELSNRRTKRHEREAETDNKERKKGAARDEGDAADDAPSRDPKRRDVVAHQRHDSAAAPPGLAPRGGGGAGAAAAVSSSQRPVASQLDVSMNLSSDSSEEEEEDDDD